jgi:hypothetical protein
VRLFEPRQKVSQINGVVMDVIGIVRLWRDVDRAHPDGVGHGQIAGIILEHCGSRG